MRVSRFKLFFWVTVGVVVFVFLVTTRKGFHRSKTLRTKHKPPIGHAVKSKSIKPITDNEILGLASIGDQISYLKYVYTQKMKYLKENKKIQTMGRRQNCTDELVKAKPGIWCHDLSCNKHMAPVGSSEIFASISRPLRAVHADSFKRIQEVFRVDTLKRTKYVFLLAVSENHYLEAQATIQTLDEKVFPNITNYAFYVYDMGLSAQQRKMLQTYKKATVRTYPFDLLPPRIHLFQNYTWKPILIQAHIDVGEFVLYMDASVRLLKDLVPLFEKASFTGFLMTQGFHSLAQHTSSELFKYFGDSACAFSSYIEYEGAFIVFRNEEFSRKLLLEPWVACALDPLCMSARRELLGCRNIRKYSKCHRFDLAVMTVMLVKLFRDEITTFSVPRGRFHYVKQGRTNVTNYLESLMKKRAIQEKL